MIEFKEFPKIARLSRQMTITEKIDGSNASIIISEDGEFATASRTRLIVPGDDNFGFSKWAHENKDELMKLGPGRHFGEWWGNGINRGYGLPKGDKRFSLFNTSRWKDKELPKCVSLVPILYEGLFDTETIMDVFEDLKAHGSFATPFMNPEGIVVYHSHANICFKKTFENDEAGKGGKG